MTSKIDELNEALDNINCGQTPKLADQEIAELLEIAVLLRQADLPVHPPQHILSAAVQRATEGLAAAPAPRRSVWRYSGLLGVAAALLIFAGIHGFPSIQQAVPLVTDPPPSASGSSPAETRSVSSSSTPAYSSPPSPAQEHLTSSPATMPAAASSPVPPAVQPASRPKLEAPPQTTEALPQSRKSPAASMKAALPPSSTPATAALRLPGRTPDSLVNDPATGVIRQSFDTGTTRELILTQRSSLRADSNKSPQSGQFVLREVDKGKTEPAPPLNKVVVIVNAQEVTLEGRQTIQELTELAQTLTN